MSTKVEKRKQNRFAKMVALKNLLEKNSDGIDLEPPEKKKSKITEVRAGGMVLMCVPGVSESRSYSAVIPCPFIR